MPNLENTLTLTKEKNLTNSKEQKNFLESTLGKVINTGLNLGLRVVLPDFIENEVIGIKDTILKEGFGAGIKKCINSAIDLGKSAIGIFTGKFGWTGGFGGFPIPNSWATDKFSIALS